MNYNQFKESLLQSLREAFPPETNIQFRKIRRNNGIELDALSILEHNRNIAPTIYLNYYYREYLITDNLTKIQQMVLEDYKRNLIDQPIDVYKFTDFEKMKPHVVFKMIHKEKNQNILSDIPSFEYMDLSIVFYLLFTASEGRNASILIQNSHLNIWNTNKEELFALAAKNTPELLPYQLKSMSAFLQDMATDTTSVFENTDASSNKETNSSLAEKTDITSASSISDTMFVLTNNSKLNGACCILYPDLLKNFSLLYDCDIYILPSSIHEVLLMPAYDKKNIEELNHLVQEVNASQLEEEEILSDHVYYYSRNLNVISM